MTKATKGKLPKKLYVYREQDGDDAYLLCYETLRECADLQENRQVGIYELTSTGFVVVSIDVRKDAD